MLLIEGQYGPRYYSRIVAERYDTPPSSNMFISASTDDRWSGMRRDAKIVQEDAYYDHSSGSGAYLNNVIFDGWNLPKIENNNKLFMQGSLDSLVTREFVESSK